ncbi:hypothetical protein M0804_011853 [Polistes exclamans]|nr:hypothetical protein M0804_011853 [Polistes exclamans]
MVGLHAEGDVLAYLKQINFHGPVQEYLSHLGKTTISREDNDTISILTEAIPFRVGQNIAGTFRAAAVNHNSYECYVCPRVTQRRIKSHIPQNFNLTPLNPALLTEYFLANKNFLGYDTIEVFPPDARGLLKNHPGYASYAQRYKQLQTNHENENIESFYEEKQISSNEDYFRILETEIIRSTCNKVDADVDKEVRDTPDDSSDEIKSPYTESTKNFVSSD